MGTRNGPGPQGLKEFLTILEFRLAALPMERLRTVLVAHAERLPARNRERFLSIFAPPTAAPGALPSSDQSGPAAFAAGRYRRIRRPSPLRRVRRGLGLGRRPARGTGVR
jgi:hypothetical protein